MITAQNRQILRGEQKPAPGITLFNQDDFSDALHSIAL